MLPLFSSCKIIRNLGLDGKQKETKKVVIIHKKKKGLDVDITKSKTNFVSLPSSSPPLKCQKVATRRREQGAHTGLHVCV